VLLAEIIEAQGQLTAYSAKRFSRLKQRSAMAIEAETRYNLFEFDDLPNTEVSLIPSGKILRQTRLQIADSC
jgi:hypothetical protein